MIAPVEDVERLVAKSNFDEFLRINLAHSSCQNQLF